MFCVNLLIQKLHHAMTNLVFLEPVRTTKVASAVPSILTLPENIVKMEQLRCVRLKTDA